MATETLELEIVTPDGLALEEQVTEFTAPSVDGEFGVLPGHRPLLAALATGIVSYKRGGEEVRVAVGNGFVEVNQDKAVLLTDHFITKDDVDPVRVRLELKETDERLDNWKDEPGSAEHMQLIADELWAAVQLELYGDPPPPIVRTYTFAGAEPERYHVTTDIEKAQAAAEDEEREREAEH